MSKTKVSAREALNADVVDLEQQRDAHIRGGRMGRASEVQAEVKYVQHRLAVLDVLDAIADPARSSEQLNDLLAFCEANEVRLEASAAVLECQRDLLAAQARFTAARAAGY